jgi:nitrogen regulatory protein P-II 2
MDTHRKKLLIITAEAALERRLAADLVQLGAHGYTVLDARGAGSRGERAADWEADRSVQFQVVCEPDTAAAIAAHLRDTYFQHYAMTIFIADVEVLRSSKF